MKVAILGKKGEKTQHGKRQRHVLYFWFSMSVQSGYTIKLCAMLLMHLTLVRWKYLNCVSNFFVQLEWAFVWIFHLRFEVYGFEAKCNIRKFYPKSLYTIKRYTGFGNISFCVWHLLSPFRTDIRPLPLFSSDMQSVLPCCNMDIWIWKQTNPPCSS